MSFAKLELQSEGNSFALGRTLLQKMVWTGALFIVYHPCLHLEDKKWIAFVRYNNECT